MQTKEWLARTTAGVIACAVLLALVPPLLHAWSGGASLFQAIWGLLRMFTIITNLLVGVVFAWLAARGREAVPPLLLGGTMLAIVLVGVVFNLLLSMLPHQTAWDAIGDTIHHVVAPLLVPLWWLAFAPHGRLRWSAPFAWALYPIAYCAYSFVRAHYMPPGAGLRYPYFFIDIDLLGVQRVAINIAAIAAGFLLVGLVAVAIDRRLAATAAQ